MCSIKQTVEPMKSLKAQFSCDTELTLMRVNYVHLYRCQSRMPSVAKGQPDIAAGMSTQ